MGAVLNEIRDLLLPFNIDLNNYIEKVVKEGPTTLEGVDFICKNLATGKSSGQVGMDDLKMALDSARSAGKRGFAGQIRKDDVNNKLLQGSFGVTKGLGFRQIYHLDDRPGNPRHFMSSTALKLRDSDGREFDSAFGEMLETVNVNSLHFALNGPEGMPSLPGQEPEFKPELERQNKSAVSNVHIDEKGFVFATRDGKVYLSEETCTHVLDELGVKSILSTGESNWKVSFQTHTNTIVDHQYWGMDSSVNGYLRKSQPRGTLGIEYSRGSKNLQGYIRGGWNINMANLDPRRLKNPTDLGLKDITKIHPVYHLPDTIVIGIRGTHDIFGSK